MPSIGHIRHDGVFYPANGPSNGNPTMPRIPNPAYGLVPQPTYVEDWYYNWLKPISDSLGPMPPGYGPGMSVPPPGMGGQNPYTDPHGGGGHDPNATGNDEGGFVETAERITGGAAVGATVGAALGLWGGPLAVASVPIMAAGGAVIGGILGYFW